jgi:hypothetical protein
MSGSATVGVVLPVETQAHLPPWFLVGAAPLLFDNYLIAATYSAGAASLYLSSSTCPGNPLAGTNREKVDASEFSK